MKLVFTCSVLLLVVAGVNSIKFWKKKVAHEPQLVYLVPIHTQAAYQPQPVYHSYQPVYHHEPESHHQTKKDKLHAKVGVLEKLFWKKAHKKVTKLSKKLPLIVELLAKKSEKVAKKYNKKKGKHQYEEYQVHAAPAYPSYQPEQPYHSHEDHSHEYESYAAPPKPSYKPVESYHSYEEHSVEHESYVAPPKPTYEPVQSYQSYGDHSHGPSDAAIDMGKLSYKLKNMSLKDLPQEDLRILAALLSSGEKLSASRRATDSPALHLLPHEVTSAELRKDLFSLEDVSD